MNNKVYFEFYRDFDDYPLSAGFYDSEILKILKEGNSYYFHHPDNDEMEEYKVTRKSIGYYEGYFILIAISIAPSIYADNIQSVVTKKAFFKDCFNFLNYCMNNAKAAIDEQKKERN